MGANVNKMTEEMTIKSINYPDGKKYAQVHTLNSKTFTLHNITCDCDQLVVGEKYIIEYDPSTMIIRGALGRVVNF